MAYWLLTTDPNRYSWANLVSDRKTVWDGITNAWALRKLRKMKKGDLALICHINDGLTAVGVAQVVSDPYNRPQVADSRLTVIDVKPKHKLRRPVNLHQLKGNRAFAKWEFWGMQRLNVVAVPDGIWKRLEALSRA